MTVTGTFAAPVDPDSTHCGPPLPEDVKGAVRTFDWEVKMDARTLDDEGFVMDNATVKAYFQSIRVVDKSCEILAQEACAQLWRPNFRTLTVKIWGADWANVECVARGGRNA